MPEKSQAKKGGKGGETKQTSANQDSQIQPLQKLKLAAAREKERRDIIRQFIETQLQRDVDYGQISIKGRATKPTLFKPGMEKIFALFDIVSILEKDEETLSMLTIKDVVVYKCKLYQDGEFISEGRGACAISEKGRVNDAIKIAEKRARMDACLNLGFSEYFTQDLDDWDKDKLVDNIQAPVVSTDVDDASLMEPVELVFHVEHKEEKTSRSGSGYAELATDRGRVIAFRNTKDLFQANRHYRATGSWEARGDRRAFLITGPSSAVVEVSGDDSARSGK